MYLDKILMRFLAVPLWLSCGPPGLPILNSIFDSWTWKSNILFNIVFRMLNCVLYFWTFISLLNILFRMLKFVLYSWTFINLFIILFRILDFVLTYICHLKIMFKMSHSEGKKLTLKTTFLNVKITDKNYVVFYSSFRR